MMPKERECLAIHSRERRAISCTRSNGEEGGESRGGGAHQGRGHGAEQHNEARHLGGEVVGRDGVHDEEHPGVGVAAEQADAEADRRELEEGLVQVLLVGLLAGGLVLGNCDGVASQYWDLGVTPCGTR